MKYYIKSDSASDIIRQNQRRPEGGYLYIFKHGIGPGTLPRDVEIIKTKDLPNSYTAVWTDRFLTTSELKEYDIPSETEINRYLDRIGYCQKDGDVVPCDDIEACGNITASTEGYPEYNLYAERRMVAHLLDKEIEEALSDKFPEDSYYLSGNIIDEDTIGFQGYGDESTTKYIPTIKEVLKRYGIKGRVNSNRYIGKYVSFNLYDTSEETDKLLIDLLKANDVKSHFDVNACSVTAATKPHPKIPEGWERVPEGDDDDGNWGTIAKALPNNQGYYWINIIEDEQGRRCFELEVGYRGDNGAIGEIWKAASKPFYRLGDIVKYADTKWRQLQAEYDEDVEACGDIKASISIKADGVPNYKLGSYMGAMLKKFTINLSVYGEGGPIYDLEESYSGSLRDCINHMITYQKKIDAEGLDADLSLEPWDMAGQSSRYFRGDCRSILNDLLDEDYITEDEYDEYIDKCSSIVASTKPKYMANMVSCASDPNSYGYLVKGYFDGAKRGLADDAWADTLTDANEIVNEYANKGYFIVVYNNLAGTVLEFPADAWFDEENMNMELGDF